MLYADTSSTLARLADVATGNVLLSGGVGVAPSWGKVDLTTAVNGTLPVANGGTGQSSALTQYGVVYGSTTSAMATTAAGTTGQILIANTGGAPTWSSTIPSTAGVTSISFGSTGLTPSTSTTGAITVAGALATGSGGTGLTSYATGDILYASATNTLSKLAAGTNGYILSLSAGVPAWIPNTGGVTSLTAGTNISLSASTGSVTVNTVGNPTFSTSVTSPIIYGGTGGSSSLTLQSTSGTGTVDSILMKVGNAGAVTALSISTTGIVTFPTTGAIDIPTGTTGERPSASTGMLRFNTTTTQFEGYNGTAWGSIGGGATGGGTDQMFYNNGQTITTSYTLPASTNSGTFGAITINAGATVTVPTGQYWTVV